MKIEVVCRQCGKEFVRYAYVRIARCEACRKLNREREAGNS